MNHGERVSGRYKVIKKVGAGGMANVYLAEDLILEREVAVKLMSLDFQNDPDSLRRFQREALSTTELTHPNIVNVYDVGEGEQPYIVMEYVDGMDLKEYVIENHPIPYQKVIKIMDQILDAIAYAHKNNVIHRDIKPHNILIDKNDNIKITDFGIAVALSQNSITQTNSLLGSVQYISPEQAKGNMVTKQSDIYSLGIVLYELLTGSVPFEGESAVSIALKHFQTPIPSLKDFDSRIPQALENVVLKATAKENKNRYQTVEEMQADLKTSLLPSRRDEPVFIPKDINDEDTLVMDAALIDAAATAPVNPAKTQAVATDPTIDEAEVEPEKKPKKRGWLIFGIVALIGILITLALYFSQPKEVIIPDNLIGLTLDEVIELLDENNLELGETLERSNDDYEEGLIFRTNPGVGSTVIEGTEIDVYVSLGEEPFTMKDYEGEVYNEVRAELTDLGFTVESEEATHETVPSGEIIAQDIDAGEEVIISETTITFTVSTGRPAIELIDLYEFSLPSVEEYVDRNNLRLTTTEESSDEVVVGSVIRQEPAAGTTLYSGDEVSVVLSTGPEETRRIVFTRELEIPYEERLAEPEDETDNEPADNGSENTEPELLPSRIEIYIDDLEKNMDTATHVFMIDENTRYRVEFVVEEGESATYRILRDGEEIIVDTISP